MACLSRRHDDGILRSRWCDFQWSGVVFNSAFVRTCGSIVTMDLRNLMESLDSNDGLSEEEKNAKMDMFVAKYQKSLQQNKGKKANLKLSCESLKATWLNFLCSKEEQDARLDSLNKMFSQVERSIDRIEKFCGTYQLLWKLKNFEKCINEARAGTRTVIQSPVFDSHRNGYKLQLSLCPIGEGKALHEAMSLFFSILKGSADSFLRWPFQCPIKFTLLNQKAFKQRGPREVPGTPANHESSASSFDQNRIGSESKKIKDNEPKRDFTAPLVKQESLKCEDHTVVFHPNSHPTNEPFLQRPTDDRNRSLGFQKFILLSDLLEGGFVEDDMIFIRVEVDLSMV